MEALTPRPLYPQGISSGMQWIGRRVGRRAGLDSMVREPSLAHAGNRSTLGHPARNVVFMRTELSRILFESNRLIIFIPLEPNQGISVEALVIGS
jgi:hypothetical protein